MAKKKHGKSASTPISAKELVSRTNQSDPRFREDRVRKIFNKYQQTVNKVKSDRPQLCEGMDYDQVRMKRRITALLNTLDEVTERTLPICPEHPDTFTIEKDWTIANAVPAPAYDLEEEVTFTLLGAAIWMLDQIRDQRKIREIAPHFPKDPELLSSTKMPQIFDLSHSEEMLMGMLYLLQNRNADCTGMSIKAQKKDASGLVVRRYMDSYTAANKHRQDVPSRNRFEAVMACIPKKAKEQAAKAYESKFWELIERYYRCRSIYVEQEAKLNEEMEAFQARARQTVDKLHQATHNTPTGPLPTNALSLAGAVEPYTAVPAAPDYLKLMQVYNQLETEESAILDQMDDVDEQVDRLYHYVRGITTHTYDQVVDLIDADAAEIWKDFDVGDPYELCFGFLYLLESGSDLPWLYYPGVNLMTLISAALPWPRNDCKDDLPGIWDYYDEEADDIVGGFMPSILPKRIKEPELENWYRLAYVDGHEPDPEYLERYNLAQIIYEITGCIMPRTPGRYQPALEQLDRYGITGKKALHPLMYCMALLGEGRFQSRGDQFNADVPWSGSSELIEQKDDTSDSGASVDELKAKIAALQGEIRQLKNLSYEAGRQVRDERKRYEELEQQTAHDRLELVDLRELVFNQQENLYQDETPAKDITFPYKTERRIVVFGGHDSWAREIKPKLPGVRFIDREMLPNADIIRRADVVWIQSNALSHAFFYRIIDEVRKYNIPLRYFTYASATKCAEQVVREDMNA